MASGRPFCAASTRSGPLSLPWEKIRVWADVGKRRIDIPIRGYGKGRKRQSNEEKVKREERRDAYIRKEGRKVGRAYTNASEEGTTEAHKEKKEGKAIYKSKEGRGYMQNKEKKKGM